MKKKTREELKTGILEAREILTGKRQPARVRKYDGHVLVEIVEHGKTTWKIAHAALEIKQFDPDEFETLADVIVAVRRALRQSQNGFAELLNVSIGTILGWEQGRHTPTGAALRLLNVAAKNPEVLIDETDLMLV